MAAPNPTSCHRGASLSGSCLDLEGFASRTAADANATATNTLYHRPGSTKPPPINANGADAITKGRKSLTENALATTNRIVVMVATRMFSTSAAGFISSGATANSAIVARYPDPPPCPTDEYNVAARKMQARKPISGGDIPKGVYRFGP